MAKERRRRGRVYVAAAAMSLGLVGLGVGIGALIWADDSPTKTAAPTAANSAARAGAKSPGAGNYNEGATIHIKEGIGPSYTSMTLSPGSDTNCTKDETVGRFPVADGSETVVLMRVRSDLDEGKCFFQKSWHTWKVELPGGGGELGLFEQKGGTPPKPSANPTGREGGPAATTPTTARPVGASSGSRRPRRIAGAADRRLPRRDLEDLGLITKNADRSARQRGQTARPA